MSIYLISLLSCLILIAIPIHLQKFIDGKLCAFKAVDLDRYEPDVKQEMKSILRSYELRNYVNRTVLFLLIGGVFASFYLLIDEWGLW